MTFDELVAEVYTLTNRPDLAAETATAIKQAIIRLHGLDFWWQDRDVILLQFDTKAFLQQFDTSIVDRFRSISFIRLWDPAGTDPQTGMQTGLAGDLFDEIDPADPVNAYSKDKSNVYYIAGSSLSLRARVELQYVLFGYFQFPRIFPTENLKSWIAAQYPYAIVFDAARVIFKTIGYDDQASAYQAFAAEQFAAVKTTGIKAEGA